MDHIVHINFSITTGGIDTMLMDIMNQQIKFNKTSLVVINSKIEETVLKKLDKRITVYRIGRTEGSFSLWSILKLNIIIWCIKPSILHCHNANIARVIFNSIPKLLTVHDIGYPVKEYKKYNLICAISNAVNQDIKKKDNSIPVKTVYNGIDARCIKTGRQHTKSSKFKIVVISRLEHIKKGQDLIIKALEKVLEQNLQFEIIVDFIGAGNSKEYLGKMIHEANLQEHIFLLGEQTRDTIHNKLQSYDLLIQPSRYEGFGLTIIEAMFAKVPVLASNIDGPNEIIGNGNYGYLFKSEDINDLAEKICELYNLYMTNYKEYIKKTNMAYLYVKENFDIKNTAANYLNCYHSLIEKQ
ncbi:glycosyltransferase family 4 protein [uncultured Draconibacterium sp.]|uniref:glycosyltransferase family 4 protein n=1 Tax=uncultured Draconibacterium sp. TaxID=1573823 RepID=UPI0029C949AB|nr:glycosyltransferase family 4 protein [uncultured Draconibacterium sp.]